MTIEESTEQLTTDGENDRADQIRDAVRKLSAQSYETQESEQVDETVDDEGSERIVEALLFASERPLKATEISQALPEDSDISSILLGLQKKYNNRGVNLVEVASKWRFQTAQDLAYLFVKEKTHTRRLGQAALETLAIIGYGQPVTRAEIEAVRGVSVSKGVIDALFETGWIKQRGRRKSPGRPMTFGTTDAFLEHFGLANLDMLPGKSDLEVQGLLSDKLPDGLPLLDGEFGVESDEVSDELVSEEENVDFVTDFIDPQSDVAH